MVARQRAYWTTVYKRTWKGSVVTSFVMPLLYVPDGDAAVAEVGERGLHPANVLVRRSSLEDVFLHLTGRTLVD